MDDNPYNPLSIPEASSSPTNSIIYLLPAGILFLLGAAAVCINFGMFLASLLFMTDQHTNSGKLAIIFSLWMIGGFSLLKAAHDFWLAKPRRGIYAIVFAIIVGAIPFMVFN